MTVDQITMAAVAELDNEREALAAERIELEAANSRARSELELPISPPQSARPTSATESPNERSIELRAKFPTSFPK